MCSQGKGERSMIKGSALWMVLSGQLGNQTDAASEVTVIAAENNRQFTSRATRIIPRIILD
jgi:hypothetical protein